MLLPHHILRSPEWHEYKPCIILETKFIDVKYRKLRDIIEEKTAQLEQIHIDKNALGINRGDCVFGC